MREDMKELLNLKAYFSPQHVRAYGEIDSGTNVAHYTTAEAALSILENQEIWLRNTVYMNDSTEMIHGFNQLDAFFNNHQPSTENFELLQEFITTLNLLNENLLPLAVKYFDESFPIVRENAYCCSLSLHDAEQDRNGKLSMWRGYGKNQPAVALIINSSAFLQVTDDYGAYALPVVYGDQQNFIDGIRESIVSIKQGREWLEELDIDTLGRALLNSFTANTIARKHPGFSEELEWRIFHFDKTPLHNRGKLEKKIVILAGRPQVVMAAPLRNFSAEGIFGTDLNEIINSVIIGPTANPKHMREVFIEKLNSKGIDNAESRVSVSDIPWRN